jgi:hypothetical protein
VEFLSAENQVLSREQFTGYRVTKRGLNLIEAVSPR